jgi:RimJ/RimL family protein N-acetyltransferase
VETAQLVLRAHEVADIDPVFAIQGDREAMRHTYCAPDREATWRHLEAHAAQLAANGFAPWVAVLRETGDVVGWGGLMTDPFDPGWGPEVGYFIDKACWRRGLASEIVGAALALAFAKIGLPEVRAFACPENPASIRVLEKLGFQLQGYVARLERNQYRIRREEWQPGA